MSKNIMTNKGLPDKETGYTVFELLAALSPQQNERLVHFARLRIERLAGTGVAQDCLARVEPEELVSRTIAMVLIGEKDAKAGRRISERSRASTEAFLRSLQAIINSDLANLVRRAQARHPHVQLDHETGDGSCSLVERETPGALAARRDLQEVIFAKLYQRAASEPKLLPVIRSAEEGFLHDERLANAEPDRGLVYRVRMMVRQILRELAQEFSGPEATGKEMLL